jgi:ribosomal-protein-alanine N-acetyltransferase
MIIRAMSLADLPAVLEIDQASFALPWSENSFRKELTENKQAHFLVAEIEAPVVGFAGYWSIVDECHIHTLATHPDWRRRGIGEQLLLAMLTQARQQAARLAILEVRASNQPAIALYRKHGFAVNRVRTAYYRNNNEDALEMLLEMNNSLITDH